MTTLAGVHLARAGLVSLWEHAEPSGTTLVDSGPGGNPGTYAGSGVTLAQASMSESDTTTAVLFNGTTGKATVPDHANLNFLPNGKFSVEMLVKPTTVAASKYYVAKATLGVGGYGMGIVAGGQFTLGIGVSSNPGGTPLVAGKKYMLAMTSDGTNVRGYINGVEVVNVSRGGNAGSAASLTIGAGFGSFADAEVQFTAVYSRQLSVRELVADASLALQPWLDSEVPDVDTSSGVPLLAPQSVATAAVPPAANTLQPYDISGGSITDALPNAPADGTIIEVKLVKVQTSPIGTSAAAGTLNSLTINCAGSDVFNIAGGSTSTKLYGLGQAKVFQYHSGVWFVTSTDQGQPSPWCCVGPITGVSQAAGAVAYCIDALGITRVRGHVTNTSGATIVAATTLFTLPFHPSQAMLVNTIYGAVSALTLSIDTSGNFKTNNGWTNTNYGDLDNINFATQ